MIDEKKLKEIENLVPKLLSEGFIKKNKEYQRLVDFYKEKALDSLNSANLLLQASVNSKVSEQLGFKNFNGYLWTINASYYSMFYICNALLASEGIKITAEVGVHKILFKTFIYYFYLNGKITKRFVEELLEAQEDSKELLVMEDVLLQADKKILNLIQDLQNEREKRKTFTYELTKDRIEVKAKTSFERAKNFISEISKIIRG